MRHAQAADLARIVEIYNAAIPGRQATADLEPVSVESRVAWFARHFADHRPLWVEEQEGGIVAWLSFESFYGRPAYRATAEVSLYVAPEWQRRGCGARLLDRAIAAAPKLALRTLLAFIFSHNEASIHLFATRGFQRWGELPEVAEMDGHRYSLSIYGRHLSGTDAV